MKPSPRSLAVVLGCLAGGLAWVQAGPARDTPPPKPNSNALVKEDRKDLVVTVSSTFSGWPTDNALDGKLETSWFSAGDDSAAKGTKPWFQVAFPDEVTVRRVTILGNRDPQWLKGYSILGGLLELLDKDKKVLKADEAVGKGEFHDFDFVFSKPVRGVRFIRFKSLKDEGNQNSYGDIAMGEIQVE
jgi:hypothetical protein